MLSSFVPFNGIEVETKTFLWSDKSMPSIKASRFLYLKTPYVFYVWFFCLFCFCIKKVLSLSLSYRILHFIL